MTNIKDTREYQLAIEDYKKNIKSYLSDDPIFRTTKSELDAITKTLSFFGMTTVDQNEIIRQVNLEL